MMYITTGVATRVFQPSVISGGLRAAWAGRIQMSASGKKGEIGGRGHVQAMGADSALFCQAAENNKGYIAEVLQRHLLTSKFTDSVAADKPLLVLEIASDTGQHVAHFFATFSSKFPCVWQPSDLVSDTFSSIRYYATETEGALSRDNTCLEQPSYVLDPILLDVTEKSWAVHTENSSYWCKPQPIAARSQSSGAGKEDTIIPEELRAGKDSHFDAVINSNMIHITPYECCEGLFAGVNKVLRKGGKFFLYGPFNVDGHYTSVGNRNFDEYLRWKNSEWGIRDVEAIEALARQQLLCIVERHQMPANNLCLVFEKVE